MRVTITACHLSGEERPEGLYCYIQQVSVWNPGDYGAVVKAFGGDRRPETGMGPIIAMLVLL